MCYPMMIRLSWCHDSCMCVSRHRFNNNGNLTWRCWRKQVLKIPQMLFPLNNNTNNKLCNWHQNLIAIYRLIWCVDLYSGDYDVCRYHIWLTTSFYVYIDSPHCCLWLQDLKDGYSKMRDQVRMGQIALENMRTADRLVQDELETCKEDLTRQKALAEEVCTHIITTYITMCTSLHTHPYKHITTRITIHINIYITIYTYHYIRNAMVCCISTPEPPSNVHT